MEALTLGQIAAATGLVVGLVTGLGLIFKLIGKAASNWLAKNLQPISEKLNTIDGHFDDFDKERCKDYLVQFIAKVDGGHKPSDTELERFYENYDRYTTLGGNSYIRTEVSRLKSPRKI